MAYTTDQLVALYKNANLGQDPDAATKLTIDAYATQSQVGGITDAAAMANTLKLVNSTTAVAIETYQFFTGKAPSAAGLAYLVHSDANTADLNDAYYAKFSAENRFINFAINLGVFGDGATAFAASYGNTTTSTVTYAQVVASAYDKIIGNSVATAAGVDVAATVAFFSRQANIDYLTAFVKANGITDAAKVDLAIKAALIGEILNAATVSGLGGYAQATAAMIADLSDGTLTSSDAVNILTAYPSTGTVGTVFNLTTGIDTFVGTNNNDTFNATATSAATSGINLLDTIDGGAGIDTLNLSNAGAAGDLDPSKLTVKNVEVVNLTSTTGLAGGALDVSAWTGLTTANVALSGPATVDQTVTAAGTTAVSLTAAAVTTGKLTVQGGSNVTVTSTGGTTGAIDVGSTTAATGVVTINSGSTFANGADATLGAISVKGGTTVSITEGSGISTATNTAAVANTGVNYTVTQGAVSVTGTSSTTAVTVTQAAAATVGSATVETNTFTFGALTTGQSVTFGGLTYTATAAQTATQVGAAFANLAAGATTGAGTGTYSGTFTSNYTTGANTLGAVTATGVTGGNLANITASGAGSPVVTSNAGTYVNGVNGVIGVNTGAVTITDVNAASGTVAGKLASVTLTNATAATINSNALTSLTLTDANATINAVATNSTVSKALTVNVAGGVNTVADTNNELTSLTVNASAAGSAGFTAGGVTSLTVNGSKLLTLTNAAGLSALKTVAVSGAGGLTANFGASTTVTTVDTSASTGTTSVTINGAKAGFVGGAGVDKVTINGALVTGSSINLGAGNDSLLGTTVVDASTTTVIDGGAGIDTVASTLINNGNGSLFKNFEVVGLSGNTLDLSLLTGSTIQSLELVAGGGGTFTAASKTQSLAVTGSSGSATVLTFADVSGTADAYSISFNAVGSTTSTATAVAAGSVSIAGIETVNIASGSASGLAANSISLTDAAAKVVNVTGSQALTLGLAAGFGNTVNAGVSLIDASTATGAITISATSIGNITADAAGLTIKTGSGADVIGVSQALTLNTGSGNDSVTVTATGVGSTLTLGAGADTVNVSAAVGATGITITDLSSGDKLVFKDTGAETFTSTKVDVSAATTLTDALNAAAASATGGANGVITWFQYGTNTYIVEDNNNSTSFNVGTDIVVKLTGLIDLSTATLSGGAAGAPTLTLA